jgi:hypothetical protein
MNLLCLAPEIQREILFLPPVMSGHDPIDERQLRAIVALLDWKKQRRMWYDIRVTSGQLMSEICHPIGRISGHFLLQERTREKN